MAKYSIRSCSQCGLRLPQPEMLRKTVQVVTGNSRKAVSGTELIFAILGNKNARKSTMRTFTSPNKRSYVRNKEVWECYKCAGVETPAEERIRIEREHAAAEQVRLAKERDEFLRREQIEKDYLLRKQRIEEEIGTEVANQNPRLLHDLIEKNRLLEEGSLRQYLWRLIPQFFASLCCAMYIPVAEYYLRGFAAAALKFFVFYIAVVAVRAVVGEEHFYAVFIVPLVMGGVDLAAGISFFGRGAETKSVLPQPLASRLPPPLPASFTSDGGAQPTSQEKLISRRKRDEF